MHVEITQLACQSIPFDLSQFPIISVVYQRTAIGWFNLYYPGAHKPAYNVSPDVFKQLFPTVSTRSIAGYTGISLDALKSLDTHILERKCGVYSLWSTTDATEWYAEQVARGDELPEEIRNNLPHFSQLISDRIVRMPTKGGIAY